MAVKLVLPFVFQNRASDYLEEISLTDERNRCVYQIQTRASIRMFSQTGLLKNPVNMLRNRGLSKQKIHWHNK